MNATRETTPGPAEAPVVNGGPEVSVLSVEEAQTALETTEAELAAARSTVEELRARLTSGLHVNLEEFQAATGAVAYHELRLEGAQGCLARAREAARLRGLEELKARIPRDLDRTRLDELQAGAEQALREYVEESHRYNAVFRRLEQEIRRPDLRATEPFPGAPRGMGSNGLALSSGDQDFWASRPEKTLTELVKSILGGTPDPR